MHKIANVLDALPKSIQPKAKAALHEIYNAENREAADAALDRFLENYDAKNPKAAAKPRAAARSFLVPRRPLDPPAVDDYD